MHALRRVLPQLLTLLALAALATLAFPGFLSIELVDGRLVGPVIDILKRGALVALLAVGMTLVIATRGIDLSVGAVMAICGAVAASAVSGGMALLPALGLALLAGLAAGLWNGALVAVAGIQPIVATLILMTAGRGIAQLITEGRILTFSHPGFAFLGAGDVLGLPVPAWLWLLTGLAVTLLMRRTALGLLVEAVGVNRRASALAGVNARVLLIAVYMASGLCAALAGLVAAADIRGADANHAGLWLELDAILAVVIGGGSLMGGRFCIAASIMGATIIQTIDTGILLAGFPSEYNLVIKAALVVAILVIQSPTLLRALAGEEAAPARGAAPRRPPAREGGRVMNPRLYPLAATIAIFLVTCVLCWLRFPFMLSTRVAGNLLTDNAYLGIVAVGMTVVILSGGIDLSVGSVIAFSGVFIAVMLRDTGLHPLAVFALLLAVATAFGAGMGGPDPPPRHAGLHRDAGGHVPRARGGLHADHRVRAHPAPVLRPDPARLLADARQGAVHADRGADAAERRWPA